MWTPRWTSCWKSLPKRDQLLLRIGAAKKEAGRALRFVKIQLSAAAYDHSKQILYLRFRNTGDVYRYFELPDADYRAVERRSCPD